VLPIGYDEQMCKEYFLPQLLLYFLRLFNLYDFTLQGYTLESFKRHGIPNNV
jgi:hypothetical protein